MSLGRRRKRMRSDYSNKYGLLNKENEIGIFQDNTLQQNSNIQQNSTRNTPCVSVVTIKEDNLGNGLSNRGISMTGVLTENVDLEANKITTTFVKGNIKDNSKINVEGHLFIRNKLLVLFEKQGLSPTEKGYPCEILNLNKFNITLEKGSEIDYISY